MFKVCLGRELGTARFCIRYVYECTVFGSLIEGMFKVSLGFVQGLCGGFACRFPKLRRGSYCRC